MDPTGRDWLVTDEELRAIEVSADIDWSSYKNGEGRAYGQALRAVIILHQPASRELLTRERRFYSRVFWFLELCRVLRLVGEDGGGEEQQLMDVLETPPDDVDWDLVQALFEESGQLAADKEAVSPRETGPEAT